MAGADVSNIAQLLRENFRTPFIKSLPHDMFFLNRFKRDAGNGLNYTWKIHYSGNSSAQSYADGAALDTAGNQSIAEAAIAYRYNWVTVEVTGPAQAASRGSGGYMEALAFETKGALDDLKNELNTQMTFDYTGNASAKDEATDLESIDEIVQDTGIYGTVNRATSTWWQSYQLDNATVGRPLTISLMQDVMAELEQPARKAKPSAIYGNRSHYYDYGNLLEDRRRFVNEMTLDGGIKALDFEGIPVIAAVSLAAGSLFFLDESEWVYSTLQDFETTPKSVSADSDRFIVTHYSALLCTHTGRQARIDDLS